MQTQLKTDEDDVPPPTLSELADQLFAEHVQKFGSPRDALKAMCEAAIIREIKGEQVSHGYVRRKPAPKPKTKA